MPEPGKENGGACESQDFVGDLRRDGIEVDREALLSTFDMPRKGAVREGTGRRSRLLRDS
jgi:hypothetical protein